MRNKMPSMFGAGKAQTKLLESMPEIFSQVCICWTCEYPPNPSKRPPLLPLLLPKIFSPSPSPAPPFPFRVHSASLAKTSASFTPSPRPPPQTLLLLLLPLPTQVQREHHLPVGDFPDPARFKEILAAFDLLQFPKLTSAMIKQVRKEEGGRRGVTGEGGRRRCPSICCSSPSLVAGRNVTLPPLLPPCRRSTT